MALGPEKLARASALKPWKTVGIWIGMLLLAGFLSSQLLADALTTDFRLTDNPESEQAKDLVEELRGESAFVEFIVITSDTASAGDPANHFGTQCDHCILHRGHVGNVVGVTR